MSNTIRILYPGIHSRSGDYLTPTLLTLTWPPIHRDSIVLISASEYRTNGIEAGVPVIDRYIGDAEIRIGGIAPEEGVVHFVVTVDWKSPLDIAVDFVVLDPPPLMVDAGSGAVYPLPSAPANQHALHYVDQHLSAPRAREFRRLLVGDAVPVAAVRKAKRKAKGKRRR
jgi:hypothetical protein